MGLIADANGSRYSILRDADQRVWLTERAPDGEVRSPVEDEILTASAQPFEAMVFGGLLPAGATEVDVESELLRLGGAGRLTVYGRNLRRARRETRRA